MQDADDGDTTTCVETLIDAAEQVESVRPDGEGTEELVGDKSYHSNQSLVDFEVVGIRSYVSEPDRGRRNWKKNLKARAAVYCNRRRIRGPRGLRLLRLRGERSNDPVPNSMRPAAAGTARRDLDAPYDADSNALQGGYVSSVAHTLVSRLEPLSITNNRVAQIGARTSFHDGLLAPGVPTLFWKSA